MILDSEKLLLRLNHGERSSRMRTKKKQGNTEIARSQKTC